MCSFLYNLSGAYLQPQKDVKIDHLGILMFFPLVSRPDSAIFSLVPSLIMNWMRPWKEVFSWLKQAKASFRSKGQL